VTGTHRPRNRLDPPNSEHKANVRPSHRASPLFCSWRLADSTTYSASEHFTILCGLAVPGGRAKVGNPRGMSGRERRRSMSKIDVESMSGRGSPQRQSDLMGCHTTHYKIDSQPTQAPPLSVSRVRGARLRRVPDSQRLTACPASLLATVRLMGLWGLARKLSSVSFSGCPDTRFQTVARLMQSIAPPTIPASDPSMSPCLSHIGESV
jgi:hypothetical protein